MHISGLIEKQDIDAEKQDIHSQKQDIGIPDTMTAKSKAHIESLFRIFGFDTVFGRKDVMMLIGITASPASELLKKMLGMRLITPVTGQGKGKYVFRMPDNY